ncbi:type II toxin-antitoxin system HipA family toxin [Xanthovirga aplysinae]|uniref:type II toxin-antitoxin system HipA family toxin n=1 Tax=Xanthovirga aplysinae TaxID=2529853 RepID=UPI0012BB5D79|nr:type II toxin-antitoxin system HipA family toxin [Xanthovirga aplysinae]MTI30270.1 type II toxin-antitoxin system HipA family toxin [Xanthovirga aplysinae]
MVEIAEVRIWGHLVGVIAMDESRKVTNFEYNPDFVKKGYDLSPLVMPIKKGVYSFPSLNKETYKGLPGMLADSLPDKFGNAVINAWLAKQGRNIESFSPIERLCYVGTRGMGALEFQPAVDSKVNQSISLDIAKLAELAQNILNQKEQLTTNLEASEDSMLDIIRVATSAGGARAKAVIAFNDKTKEVRSGQVEAPDKFSYWLLKFDGIKEKGFGAPAGYGRIEYAYYKMANDCGINMSECRLLEENGRAHFLTKRFDRLDGKTKIHMQSLCAIAHYDYNQPLSYSYEQAFQAMRKLRLPYTHAEQFYRRMIFNVVARNQDDHTKNISFLFDPSKGWRLSPAYDMTYSYNPKSFWTGQHQMSVNGKRDNISLNDLLTVGKQMSIKKPSQIVEQIVESISKWPSFAKGANVAPKQIDLIGKTHRLELQPAKIYAAQKGGY